MNTHFIFRNPKIIFVVLLCNLFLLNAQEDSKIYSAYEDYTEAPREVVYVHLNKSTYIKGEDIGFTAYVFDKQSKKPSKYTSNLYVTIEDGNKKSIKKALLKVENGVASNVFPLDSTFSSGQYTFKAYTNWMRNFNERGYHIESIKVIDPNANQSVKSVVMSDGIDAQFLPEGGHLLNNVVNSVGVVIKDYNGLGIPEAKGQVFDKNNQLITEFQVNHLGIGRFLLKAKSNNNYTIKINHLDKAYNFRLNETVEPIGVTLSVVKHRNKAIVALVTNAESLAQIKTKPYSLAIHNGKKIDVIDVVFDSETTVIKAFELSALPSGMNVFTLFNETNQPIVERLFFNYQGLDILKSRNVVVQQQKDSIKLKFNYKDIAPYEFNNLSVSVLPQDTKSYNSHQNIISQTLLQPYVKGYIEQARYYFTEVNEDKKLELDNLLITQGWSSYDWNNIFNNSNTYAYPFEKGISVKANFTSKELNDNGEPNYVMYYLDRNDHFKVSESEKGKTNYWLENLFPEEDNTLKMSNIINNNRKRLRPASLYLQFFPSNIPSLRNTDQGMPYDENTAKEEAPMTMDGNVMIKPSRNIEMLEEVIVKSRLSPTMQRRNELSTRTNGRVYVVDQSVENSYTFLSNFLAQQGLIVGDDFQGLRARFPNTNGGGSAVFVLDDMLLFDTTPLTRFLMGNIDYIVINRFGIGERFNFGGGNLGGGFLPQQGVIKIYTKSPDHPRFLGKKSRAYEFPLTFSEQKKFYTPKYRYYNDDFYKHYGTIDWRPNLKVDANGFVSLKIEKPEVPITLFIEGIANNGAFIFEEKSIATN
ncbi:hypothetical protein [Winogradskyella sp.]|uniref:hypothetical protein n=1 Tax=Winogradskyella sp. TaxID=1883156 RepID=UPI003BA954AC